MTSDSRVTVDLDGHVLLIGVNRPDKRNAWDLQTIAEVGEAYARIAQDDDVRVAVLHGHGDHFSAGLDLAEVAPALEAGGPEVLSGGGEYDPYGLWGKQVPKPVVVAVQGLAFTLAIELCLASDIVISADDVRFRQLEIGRGIIPFGGATMRAVQQLGWGNAMRWILTAEEFGAAEALRIGLVQEVVPAGQQLARATEIAQTIARQAPLGVQGTLANARIPDRAQAVEHLKGLLPEILASDDAKEGVLSFLERREAAFTGK